MKKFELTNEFVVDSFGIKLFRIRSLVAFGCVKAGEQGGYVEKEENLSQIDNAWVYGNAEVSGNAKVTGNARVSGNAWVYGNAWVHGNAEISDNAWVSGDAEVSGNAWVSSNVDYATVKGFGRFNRNTTFFRCKDGKVCVVCGCFFGDLEGFRTIVKSTHGDGRMAMEYLAIADLMEIHFKG